jgi:glycine/D-amino acid oxidase-like deaminating enzyme
MPFLADAVPCRPGLYVLAGWQVAGVTHGPGLGRLIAGLIADGRGA